MISRADKVALGLIYGLGALMLVLKLKGVL